MNSKTNCPVETFGAEQKKIINSVFIIREKIVGVFLLEKKELQKNE